MSITPPTPATSQVVAPFIALYQALNKDNLHLLSTLYHPEIRFEDPLHDIQGLTQLTEYFQQMYQGVISIEFEIQRTLSQPPQATLEWLMHYRHHKLKGGQTITVQGMTWLTFADNGLIIQHRDYFDAGQLLYEQLPVLGGAIRYLKSRVAV